MRIWAGSKKIAGPAVRGCRGRSDLFEGLEIWEDQAYRELQGTYPVVFLSFADVKGRNFKDIRDGIISCLSEEKDGVKAWYDGFTFGTHTDIYNPWSITNFLDNRDYGTYWADTSSNGLISRLLLTADAYQKKNWNF